MPKPAPAPADEDPFAPVAPAPKPAAPAPAAPAPADVDPFAPVAPAAPAPAPAAPAADPAAPAPAKPADADPFADPFKISAEGQLPIREWNDNSGNFKIDGRLIAILDGQVRILKTTGRTTTVPMRRLSEADQKYVAEIINRHGNGLIGVVAAR
jgi:hypothetical protein